MSAAEAFLLVEPSGGINTFRIGPKEYPQLFSSSLEEKMIHERLQKMGMPDIRICSNLGLEAYCLANYLKRMDYKGRIGYYRRTIKGNILI